MKVITKKQEKEIENIKKVNNLLSNGYRAMSLCLDFEKAIIGIMKQCNLNEIEIPLNYINTKKIIETSTNPATNNLVIKIGEIDEKSND